MLLTHFSCDPSGAIPFIEKYFYDCVYSVTDLVGFCLGVASIGLWVVAQLPQFISNIRNQSAEALSPWFLAEWLLGDTCNLLGCLLQGMCLPTTTYTAMYFVLSDVFLLTQYVYYAALQNRKKRIQKAKRKGKHLHRHKNHRYKPKDELTEPLNPGAAVLGAPTSEAAAASPHCSATLLKGATAVTAAAGILSIVMLSSSAGPQVEHTFRRTLQGVAESFSLLALKDQRSWSYIIGTAVGWTSSVLYLISRISQIYKNYKRHSSEGLSEAMFACAILANCCTGTSILLRAKSWSQIASEAPWVVGTLGTVSLDITIFFQAKYYTRVNSKRNVHQTNTHGSTSAQIPDGGEAA